MRSTGLTIEQLAHATGRTRGELHAVLSDEIDAGRVLRDAAGRYRIAPEAFGRDTVRSLAAISPPTIGEGITRIDGLLFADRLIDRQRQRERADRDRGRARRRRKASAA